MKVLSLCQYSALRSLHLNLEWQAFDPKLSLQSLLHAVQSPALQTLEICIKVCSTHRCSRTMYQILKHTTALKKVTVTIPHRGPFGRRRKSFSPVFVLPHPLQVSESSRTKLSLLNNIIPTDRRLTSDTELSPAWECIEWPAERQLDFAKSVRKKVYNSWVKLEPHNYVQDDRPPKFIFLNSIERLLLHDY